MSDLVLVAYASRHGATREVAQVVVAELKATGLRAHLRHAGDVRDLDGYDAVVVGAPIYHGRLDWTARRFLGRLRRRLPGERLAVFALGPLRPDEEAWQKASQQLAEAIESKHAEPVEVRLFGGALDPARLHFPFSHMPEADERDWDAIREWARELPERLGLQTAALA